MISLSIQKKKSRGGLAARLVYRLKRGVPNYAPAFFARPRKSIAFAVTV